MATLWQLEEQPRRATRTHIWGKHVTWDCMVRHVASRKQQLVAALRTGVSEGEADRVRARLARLQHERRRLVPLARVLLVGDKDRLVDGRVPPPLSL